MSRTSPQVSVATPNLGKIPSLLAEIGSQAPEYGSPDLNVPPVNHCRRGLHPSGKAVAR